MRTVPRTPHGVIVLVMAACLSGCGFPDQDSAQRLGDDELPVALRTGSTVAETVPVDTEPATLWLIDDDRLVASRHEVAVPASVDTVTAELLAGPDEQEQERGLRSALPDPAIVVGNGLSRGIATIDLTPSFQEVSPEDQLLAVGQIVLTLTDLRGVGGVQFTLDGAPVAVPTPTGETSEHPVVREQFLALTRPPDTS